MAIKFNELTEKEYYTLRQEILSAIEGSRHEVYRDSKGMATIGIGLNLRNDDIARSVLEANLTRHKGIETKLESDKDVTTFVNASSGTFKNDAEAQTAVNGAWKTLAEKNNIKRLVNPKDPLVWINELDDRLENKKKEITYVVENLIDKK